MARICREAGAPREGEPAASRSKHRGIIVNSLAFWEASKSPLTPPWSQRWRVGARRGRTSAASTPNCSLGPGAINAVTFLQNVARYSSPRAEGPTPFNPTVVLSAMDSIVGLHHPTSVRCQLVGEAFGDVRLCQRAGGARGRLGPPSVRGLTPGCCEARTLVSQSTVTSWSPWLEKKEKLSRRV